MIHFTNEKSLRRKGYTYDRHGVGRPAGVQPHINWSHIDGPLLYRSDGQLHWLTWGERFRLSFGLANIYDINTSLVARGGLK